MDGHDDVNNDFKYSADINYDEATMAQQRDIEKQISESQPLISERLPLCEILTKEYADVDDDVYKQKIQDLMSRYQSLRRTRGDGNCFFRAFGFSYLESLLTDKEDLKRFRKVADESKDELIALGFPSFTIEDFHDTFMEVVEQVQNGCLLQALLDTFNNQGLSDYLVVYLRLLVSGHLQKEDQFYMNFVEGVRTVKEFCNQEVEPMGKESDHIHIIALTAALGVAVRIEYMDRGEGTKVISHDFPEDSKPAISLLYRPGHYDILYQ